MNKLQDNKKFIKYYYNTSKHLTNSTSKELKFNFNDCILGTSINLSNLFETIINLSSNGDVEASNFIRWNYNISLTYLNTQSKCGTDEMVSNKQRLLFKQLTNKYKQLVTEKANQVNKETFSTSVNNLNSVVGFIERKIKENKINTRPTKISIQHLIKLYQDVVEIWPYYNSEDDKIKENIRKLNESIQEILSLAELHSEKVALKNSYYISLELLDNEKSLGDTQFKQIMVSITKHNEFLKQSYLRQIVERCGEQYDLLKENMSKLLDNAISLKNIILSPILHPIEFIKNCCYAVNNIKQVGKECLEYVKNNPGKSILFMGAAVSIGVGISILSAGIASPFLAFSAVDAVIGVVATSLVGIAAVTSIAGSVIKSVEYEANENFISDFSRLKNGIKGHEEAVKEAKKAYFESLKKSNIKVDKSLENNQQALEIQESSSYYLQTRAEALESLDDSKEFEDYLDDEKVANQNTENELLLKSVTINEKVQQSKEEFTRLYSRYQTTSQPLTEKDVKPVYDRWMSFFASQKAYDQIVYITNLIKEDFKSLVDWCEIQELLYQVDNENDTPRE